MDKVCKSYKHRKTFILIQGSVTRKSFNKTRSSNHQDFKNQERMTTSVLESLNELLKVQIPYFIMKLTHYAV